MPRHVFLVLLGSISHILLSVHLKAKIDFYQKYINTLVWTKYFVDDFILLIQLSSDLAYNNSITLALNLSIIALYSQKCNGFVQVNLNYFFYFEIKWCWITRMIF